MLEQSVHSSSIFTFVHKSFFSFFKVFHTIFSEPLRVHVRKFYFSFKKIRFIMMKAEAQEEKIG
jgi:hypothetical protein